MHAAIGVEQLMDGTTEDQQFLESELIEKPPPTWKIFKSTKQLFKRQAFSTFGDGAICSG